MVASDTWPPQAQRCVVAFLRWATLIVRPPSVVNVHHARVISKRAKIRISSWIPRGTPCRHENGQSFQSKLFLINAIETRPGAGATLPHQASQLAGTRRA